MTAQQFISTVARMQLGEDETLDSLIVKARSVEQFPGFPADEGGNSSLTRLQAEVECNREKDGFTQVTDSSLTHDDLRHILRAIAKI